MLQKINELGDTIAELIAGAVKTGTRLYYTDAKILKDEDEEFLLGFITAYTDIASQKIDLPEDQFSIHSALLIRVLKRLIGDDQYENYFHYIEKAMQSNMAPERTLYFEQGLSCGESTGQTFGEQHGSSILVSQILDHFINK